MITFTLEEIQAVLDEVRAYYPEDVWPEFTAGEKGVSRDRVSASMARRTVDNTRRLFREIAREKADSTPGAGKE